MGLAVNGSAKNASINLQNHTKAFTLLFDCWSSAKIGKSFRAASWSAGRRCKTEIKAEQCREIRNLRHKMQESQYIPKFIAFGLPIKIKKTKEKLHPRHQAKWCMWYEYENTKINRCPGTSGWTSGTPCECSKSHHMHVFVQREVQ